MTNVIEFPKPSQRRKSRSRIELGGIEVNLRTLDDTTPCFLSMSNHFGDELRQLVFDSKVQDYHGEAVNCFYGRENLRFNGIIFDSSYARMFQNENRDISMHIDWEIFQDQYLREIPVLFHQRLFVDFDNQEQINFNRFLNRNFDNVYTSRTILTRRKPDSNDRLGLLTGGYNAKRQEVTEDKDPVDLWNKKLRETKNVILGVS